MVLLLGVGCSDTTNKVKKSSGSLEEKIKEHYTNDAIDTLQTTKFYVPVYSEIYSSSENMKIPLTITLSVRNTSTTEKNYIRTVAYYNTHGKEIKHYLEKPIVLNPLETMDFVVEEKDKEGGTGANFLIEGNFKNTVPVIQAVMIGTLNQQGISYLTEGIEVK
ncbi:hypothetical protein Y10_20960 [Neptunitalea sp. Y10]|uniref:DUF3124 domain-containing protein n=2 Tax=Neptunitalea lumnitzerae TaxID=2965509 RepID=A0ABQ5MK19_9FLAO|nr:hypothetical protein Y10_20960 [Neptunitalea sp. Y10]